MNCLAEKKLQKSKTKTVVFFERPWVVLAAHNEVSPSSISLGAVGNFLQFPFLDAHPSEHFLVS